ncbi:ELWxxDGT repeat protein [Flavobacterium sp.]|uniref:ELWxxDGT repeat protein n=1 Tax=Flavobacterium sp. TaxID=239 RepID=UPI00286AD74C|nr:ELWxxDGT repeat protein [Flavobacterium sp.]
MKKLLLFTSILLAFTSNAQFRLVRQLSNQPDYGPSGFLEYNGKLYFKDSNSSYVWYSDGTTAGTQQLTLNGNPPTQSGVTNGIVATTKVFNVVKNGELFFQGNTTFGQTDIYKLTSTSLTNAVVATTLDNNLYPGLSSAFFYPELINNSIVFSPANPNLTGVGVEPAYYDGANLGFLKNIGVDLPNRRGSYPIFGDKLNGYLYFSATDGTYGTTGRELYRTDGTAAGTDLFLDLNTGITDSNPTNINLLGNQLTFVGTHPTLGRELFKTNGNISNLILIKDINTAGDSNPSNVANVGGTLYFSATNGTSGQELWKSNGTNLGTVLIKDINATGDSNPNNFTQVGSDIYFTADDGINGIELWKTNGTSLGTVLVKDITPSGSTVFSDFILYNNKLFFIATTSAYGRELWSSDGTSTGTIVHELNAGAFSSETKNIFLYNNELYIATRGPSFGTVLHLYAYMDPALSTNKFQLSDKAIALFPNPSKTYFELLGEVTIEKVQVYSMLGQLVKTFEKQNQYAITDIAKGNYIVKINTADGELSKTLIIE